MSNNELAIDIANDIMQCREAVLEAFEKDDAGIIQDIVCECLNDCE